MTRIDAVVFDLGGVLINWDPRALYARLLPCSEIDAFLDEIDFFAWNHECDAGLQWADAVAQLSARHPNRAELIAAYPARFGESLVGAFDQSVALLRELRDAGVRLLALTNWPAESFRHARERFDFLDWFEGIVVSGEEAVAKPERRIFALLLERFDLDPARTMFVDDAEHNVEAARSAGMQAVRFTSAGQLRRSLADAGVLSLRA